jgi:hypothetical protein
MAQEQRFNNYAYICSNRGLVALYANDRLPDHTYSDLTNLEIRQENAISMRFGHTPLTAGATGNVPLDGAVLSLGRLMGLQQAWRYAKTSAGTLYRGDGAPFEAAPWTAIANGLNPSNRTSFVQTTTPFSSNPFLLVADSNLMLKDDGTTNTPWGYPFPAEPTGATPFIYFDNYPAGGHVYDRGEWFITPGSYNITGASAVSTTLNSISGTVESTSNNCWIIPFNLTTPTAAPLGFFVGLLASDRGGLFLEQLDVTGAGTATNPVTAAVAYCSPFQGAAPPPVGAIINIYSPTVEVAITAAGVASVSPTATFIPPWNLGFPSNTQGYAVRLQANVNDPTAVDHIRVILSFNDASFTNYMYYDIPGSSFIPPGHTGAIICPVSQFTIVGTPNFSNIASFRLDIVTTGPTEVFLLSLLTWFVDTAFPSSFGGLPYDYRSAGYNANTGSEGPSTQIVGYGGKVFYTPYVNQFPIAVQVPAITDPGFTHFRVYRRGGTLPNTWQMVGQVSLSQVTGASIMFMDTMADPVAATQNSLVIDNYPPITSTLPTPINTTFAVAASASLPGNQSTIYPVDMSQIAVGQLLSIGSGATLETVVVTSVGPNYFTAILQFPHQVGESIYGTARYRASANIACAAFERVFIAGDPNNPWRLYYSAIGEPESFPPENWIDLPGGTGEVIMGLVFTQGLLFAGTRQGWHKVISVNGSIPIAVKTNSLHGLFGVNALEEGEGVIQYLSFDGVYLFNGSTSTEFSEALQWVFRSYLEALGPIPVMDSSAAGRAAVSIGYDKSEIYVSYRALNDGLRHRAIYSQRDNRWRHDDIQASAQLYEEDSATLIFGTDAGMVFGDRVFDQDIASINPTTTTPINVRLCTASLDQGQPKNPKVYTEHTIDINTQGQNVTVGLLFDNQQTPVTLGTVNTPFRQQVNFNVNNGLGQLSRNVAFVVTGSLTTNIDIFELHLKALVEAETRESFDTYWTTYGTQEWKLVKQGYFQYTATAVVTISAYTDGNVTTPIYSVQLPPAATRTVIWKRFPAHMAKLWRFIATCPGNFTMYENSHIEVKPVCGIKGYARQPLTA